MHSLYDEKPHAAAVAATGVMIGPLSRVPNARKATSYEGMNECVGKRDSNFAGSNLVRARQNNDFTHPGVESQTFPEPDSPKTNAGLLESSTR